MLDKVTYCVQSVARAVAAPILLAGVMQYDPGTPTSSNSTKGELKRSVAASISTLNNGLSRKKEEDEDGGVMESISTPSTYTVVSREFHESIIDLERWGNERNAVAAMSDITPKRTMTSKEEEAIKTEVQSKDELSVIIASVGRRLKTILDIEAGWYYGEGERVQENVTSHIESILAELLMQTKLGQPSLFPIETGVGGVRAEWRVRGEWSFSVEWYHDNEALFTAFNVDTYQEVEKPFFWVKGQCGKVGDMINECLKI